MDEKVVAAVLAGMNEGTRIYELHGGQQSSAVPETTPPAFAGSRSEDASTHAGAAALEAPVEESIEAPVETPVEIPVATSSSKKKGGHRPKKPDHVFPVQPRVVQVVTRPKTYMNHTYRDFSSVPPEVGHVEPLRIEDMTFSQKLHHILSQQKNAHVIGWMPHGRAFRILIPKRLEQLNILRTYFGHSRYSSFLRQMSNHGLKHMTEGPDRNCYYHEFMLRGLPHLCKYMPQPKDARRLIPDPDNEPDLYKINELFPVPGGDDEKQPAIEATRIETESSPSSRQMQPPKGTYNAAAASAAAATTVVDATLVQLNRKRPAEPETAQQAPTVSKAPKIGMKRGGAVSGLTSTTSNSNSLGGVGDPDTTNNGANIVSYAAAAALQTQLFLAQQQQQQHQQAMEQTPVDHATTLMGGLTNVTNNSTTDSAATAAILAWTELLNSSQQLNQFGYMNR